MIDAARTRRCLRRTLTVALSALALAGVATSPSSARRAFFVTEYALPSGASPNAITTGPDGNLWIVDGKRNVVDVMSRSGQVLNEYGMTGSSPYSIVTGPDGDLWFTEQGSASGGGLIGRITTGGVLAEFSAGPSQLDIPVGIAVGPDQNLWSTLSGSNSVIAITTGGTIVHRFANVVAFPTGISAGPDGELWVAAEHGDTVARVTIAGAVTRVKVGVGPTNVVPGADQRKMWFSLYYGQRVGTINLSGVVTEYAVPSAEPDHIVAGAGEVLWFTDSLGNRIVRVTTSGDVDYHAIPSAHAGAGGICLGPDGRIWFTERNTGKIGAFNPKNVSVKVGLSTGG